MVPVLGVAELDLLCACARPRADRPAVERALQHAIDWSGFLTLAHVHSVGALVARNLGELSVPIPEHVSAALRRTRAETANRNLYFTFELFRLLDLLESAGIPAVSYKGPTLAERAYGNLALRQFVDLDILVRRADAARARDLLVGDGYLAGCDDPSLDEGYLQHHYDFELIRETPMTVQVEIHWRIVPRVLRFPVDYDLLAGSLQTINLSGRPLRCLADDDLLLVLSAHATKHVWNRLQWICDIAQLSASSDASLWEKAAAKASRLGAGRMLTMGAALAERLLGADIPHRGTREPWVDSAVDEVRHWLAQTANEPTIRRTVLFHAKMRERWRDRAGFALDSLFSPTINDWYSLKLPRGLSGLYFLTRIARMAGKFVSRPSAK